MDESPLINNFAVLDKVADSRVADNDPVMGGVPETPVADSVAESNVWERLPVIRNTAVEANDAL